MPDVNVYEAFKELIQRLLSGDQEVAELAAADPEGLLAAYGITDGNLDGVDFRQAVDECYHDYELAEGSKQALQSYVAAGPPPAHYEVKAPPATAGHQTPEHAVQHLQYVTYATYENNETITREIVNQQFTIDQSDNRIFAIDNSTDVSVDVGGEFDGDITVAPTASTAAGDGAVSNVGDDNVVGTGEALVAADGELNAAVGDGAVQGEQIGAANTGSLEGIQAGDQVRGASVGENTGLIAGDDVENAVVGEGNQTANLDVDASGGSSSANSGDATTGFGETNFDDRDRNTSPDQRLDGSATTGDATAGDASGGTLGDFNFNFGDGDQTNARDVQDSAVASGGEASNDQSLEVGDLDPITRKSDDPSAGELLRGLLEEEPEESGQEITQLEEVATESSQEITQLEEVATDSSQEITQLEEVATDSSQEITQLEELATDSSQEDDASLGV
jgi:hypothetical protein